MFWQLIFILFTSSILSVTAQEEVQLSDLSKKQVNLLNQAKKNVRLQYFDEAIAQLDKIIDKEPGSLDALSLKAEALYRKGDLDMSADVLEKVVGINPTFESTHYYTLGLIYQALLKIEDARKCYKAYLNTSPESIKLIDKSTNYLTQLDFIEFAINHPVPFKPEKLPPEINGESSSESLPLFEADGKTIVFTRRENNQEDIYISQLDENGKWQMAQPISAINSPQNEGAHAISADGNVLIFTGCQRPDGLGNCDLYITEKRNGAWQKPVNMGQGINTAAREAHPTLSADGRKLYYVSDRAGGFGGRDIWYTKRNEEGRWLVPKNMGPTINSEGDDESPHLHLDGQHFYFMSDGHMGMGDSDLFLSKLENGKWGEPKNLGYPINTQSKEGALSVEPSGQYAYFTSDRKLNLDNLRERQSNIYRFELPETMRPNPIIFGIFKIVDKSTKSKIVASVEVFNTLTNEIVSDFTYLPNATSPLVTFAKGNNYGVHVSAPGYTFYSMSNFNLDSLSNNVRDTIEIYMQKIKVSEGSKLDADEPIVLNNVFFESGSSDLLNASFYELNKVADMILADPSIKIQVNGHTDNVGNESNNLALSQKRAESVVSYLVGRGIKQDRLIAKGFGEKVSVAENGSEVGRSKNRRTEFIILRN